MKTLRWDLSRIQIAWLQQIRNQTWLKLEDTEMINSILYRTDYDETEKLQLNNIREQYITYKKVIIENQL